MRRARAVVLCLSHLRWDFVYQRPQHLLSRCARERDVIFFEEPVLDARVPELQVREVANGLRTATPHLPEGLTAAMTAAALRRLVDGLVAEHAAAELILWYYTPAALEFTDHLEPAAIVYDCMDELSLFHGAPASLAHNEKRLLARADVVFTGGHSLYEHKRDRHHNIHPFPSSVDVPHFAQARELLDDPPDQADIAHPRAGFFGVIDERMNLELLEELADARPELQLVMIGPIVKIDPARLPQRPNLHWLGSKRYAELPAYLAGWDVAIMPFALNEATRFISPTKTPEYLAAGRPVVSTPIRDVVAPYGHAGLAWIADTAADFAVAIDEALASDRWARQAHADAFLADLSWDKTWSHMWAHVDRVLGRVLRRSSASASAGASASAASPMLAKSGS
jgi:glycosyltransferase involved in cell wall biosynthesis